MWKFSIRFYWYLTRINILAALTNRHLSECVWDKWQRTTANASFISKLVNLQKIRLLHLIQIKKFRRQIILANDDHDYTVQCTVVNVYSAYSLTLETPLPKLQMLITLSVDRHRPSCHSNGSLTPINPRCFMSGRPCNSSLINGRLCGRYK